MIEADTWRCRAAFMDDQAVHIVGAVGQGWFGRGPLDANGADQQAMAIFPMGEDARHMRATG